MKRTNMVTVSEGGVDAEYVTYLEDALRKRGAPECGRCGGFLVDSVGARDPECPHCVDAERRVEGEPDVPDLYLSDFIKEWRHGIFKDYRDGFWTVDCRATHKWGTVGTGKSNLSLVLAIALQQPPEATDYPRLSALSGLGPEEVGVDLDRMPAFDPDQQIVHHDDYMGYRLRAASYLPGMVIMWDEMQKGLSRRMHHGWRREAEMVIQQMRKSGLVTVGNCPILMEVAEYIIFDRNQLLFRMDDRTSCHVFQRNGFVDMKKNLWGQEVAKIHHIPKAAEWAWAIYEAQSFAKASEARYELKEVGR